MIHRIFQLDEQHRQLSLEVEALRKEKNDISKSFSGVITPQVRQRSIDVGKQLKQQEVALEALEKKFNDMSYILGALDSLISLKGITSQRHNLEYPNYHTTTLGLSSLMLNGDIVITDSSEIARRKVDGLRSTLVERDYVFMDDSD